MAEHHVFFITMPDGGAGMSPFPTQYILESDATKEAERLTARDGVSHFVLEAKTVSEAVPETKKLYTDWEEIERLRAAQTEKDLAELSPPPRLES